MDRYASWPDRPDVLMCRECSTRSAGVLIPTDEREDHDEWHAVWAELAPGTMPPVIR